MGVDLFFVISGFVILWSAQGRTPWQFAVSRFARLYPVFWVALGATALVVPFVTPRQILANATMIAGYLGEDYVDGVYWTLQVELKFYVLVGLLLVLRQGHKFETWISAWLLAIIGAEFTPALRSLVIYPYSPLFIGGAVCFLIRFHGITWWRGALLATAALLAILHAGPTAKGFIREETSWIPSLVVLSIFAIVFLIAMNTLRIKCAAIAAALTYPLYLVHNVLGRTIFTKLETGSNWMSLIVTLIIIFALAFALSLLDRPLGSLVKNVAESLRVQFKARLTALRAN